MFPQLQRTVKSPTKPTHKDAKSIESERTYAQCMMPNRCCCRLLENKPSLLQPTSHSPRINTRLTFTVSPHQTEALQLRATHGILLEGYSIKVPSTNAHEDTLLICYTPSYIVEAYANVVAKPTREYLWDWLEYFKGFFVGVIMGIMGIFVVWMCMFVHCFVICCS